MWAGHAALEHELGQGLDDLGRGELAIDPDGQGLARELVHHAEPAEPAPVVGPVLHEVIGPDMVRTLRPEPEAGAVVQPQPSLLGVPPWNLEPFASPDALDPLLVHDPACLTQESRDAAVAVAALHGREFDDRGREPLFIVCHLQDPALGRARLANDLARAPLGDAEF
jgi:hypothetical protein